MSNYKVELERTENQDLEIKKHISDVKDIVKNKVNKDVNGLNSIKELLKNETLGGYIVDDFIKIENLEEVLMINDYSCYKLKHSSTIGSDTTSVSLNNKFFAVISNDSDLVLFDEVDGKIWSKRVDFSIYRDADVLLVLSDGSVICPVSDGSIIISKDGLTSSKLNYGSYGMVSDDKEEYIYFANKNNITKTNMKFEKIKSTNINESPNDIVFGFDNNIYVYYKHGLVIKLDAELNILLRIEMKMSYSFDVGKSIMCTGDSSGYQTVYNVDGKKILSKKDNSKTVQSMSVDAFDNIYSSIGGNSVTKMPATLDNKIATFDAGGMVRNTDVNKIGDIVTTSSSGHIRKYNIVRELLGYKVLKVERG